ncbi:MAG TPA: alpha/beta hydrolase [Pseudonocardia sp.]
MTGGFVLVHGGMHGSWCWDRVIPLLRHPAVAIELPGRPGGDRVERPLCLADYADAITEAAERAGHDELILVGHSMAGLSIPGAAQRLGDRLRHLVFVSALVAREGALSVEMMPQPIRAWVKHRLRRMSAQGRGFSLPEWVARWYFCNDLSEADTRMVLGRLCPEPPEPMLERLPITSLSPEVPRTYLGYRQDHTIPVFAQRRLARLVDARLEHIDGGHDGMLSNASGTASVLNRIATETFGG